MLYISGSQPRSELSPGGIWHYLETLFFFNYWSIVNLHCCVSAVWQSESVIHMDGHIATLFFFFFKDSFRFFSHIGHYRVLSRVPCAIQQVLISYLFYIS